MPRVFGEAPVCGSGGWSAALPVTGGESHAAYGQGLGNQPGRRPPGGAVGLGLGPYGAVLTVILPSMMSCLALSTAAMTSFMSAKAGLDIDRATPFLSRP